ncbi:MAG: FAD-binding oxidoreductase [Hyphomicrobiales bacterium]|nr:FAD-binding oxidoreductase [Hyphomicrobiales bacterium]MCP5370253.1 FAD-binding oxidoreductase [Hyphomicrobiales bacterium]
MATFLQKLSDLAHGDVLAEGPALEPYCRDWAGRDLGRPLAVVRPRSTAEVCAIVKLAHDCRVTVVPSGGRTGVVRGTYADRALVISLERLKAIRRISQEANTLTVEAGLTIAEVQAVAWDHRQRFPLSFGAEGSAQIGGALSTNAGGTNALRFGTARDLCLGLEAVLPDGRLLNELSSLRKSNTGLDLKQLFIGTEGTLGIITAATLRLFPMEGPRTVVLAAVPDADAAARLLRKLSSSANHAVEAAEFMSRSFVAALSEKGGVRLPFAAPTDLLLLEIEQPSSAPDGSPSAGETVEGLLAAAFEDADVLDAVIATSEAQRKAFWAIRERAAEVAFSRHPALATDISVPTSSVAPFIDQAHAIRRAIDPASDAMAIAHLGDGNVHYTIWPASNSTDLLQRLELEIEALAVAMGGSFSAEHGIGRDKLAAMERFKDPVNLDTMRRIKTALDPHNLMNPGKVYPA